MQSCVRNNGWAPKSLLSGLLFDDRGNHMSPSFTSKNGIRYRFYVSAALLSGRRDKAGSAARVAASDIEGCVVAALHSRFTKAAELSDHDFVKTQIELVVLRPSTILIALKGADGLGNQIELPRLPPFPSPRAQIDITNCEPAADPDLAVVQALARAHLWRKALSDGTYQSIEQLADAVEWHPKVVRKALRLAFLAPDITQAIINGSRSLGLSDLQGMAAYSWNQQRHLAALKQSA